MIADDDPFFAYVRAIRSVSPVWYAEFSCEISSDRLGQCGVEVHIIRNGTAARVEWRDTDDVGACYSVEVDTPEALAEQLRMIKCGMCRCCGRPLDARGKCPTVLPDAEVDDECPECGQAEGVERFTGEYPCPVCGSPRLHDAVVAGVHVAVSPEAIDDVLAGTITAARDPDDPSKGNIMISVTPRPVWVQPKGEA